MQVLKINITFLDFIIADIVRDITEAAKNYNSNDAAKWYERVSINLIRLFPFNLRIVFKGFAI